MTHFLAKILFFPHKGSKKLKKEASTIVSVMKHDSMIHENLFI